MLKLKYYKFYYVENKAGFLSFNFIYLIQKILKKNNNSYICIFIYGEEDLCTIPVVLFSPNRSVVLYGQPKKGMVFIKPTINLKNKMYKLIK